jgi:protoporphyrinogen oxidase
MGGRVLLDTRVERLVRDEHGVTAVEALTPEGPVSFPCTHVISSMPLSSLLLSMDPPVPELDREAADGLGYRDFLTVALVIPEEAGFPDNWIYVHAAEAKVGRIQNFGSWSPDMVKEGRTCLGLEYFVDEGDELWNAADDDLVALATRELATLGLVSPDKVERGFVVRVPKAYPMYDETYQANVAVIRSWIADHTPNVYPAGRNGMHRYNNQDHSMVTALLSVENILGADNDIWSVNVEEDYHEEVQSPAPSRSGPRGTGRDAPIIPREAYRQVTVE